MTRIRFDGRAGRALAAATLALALGCGGLVLAGSPTEASTCVPGEPGCGPILVDEGTDPTTTTVPVTTTTVPLDDPSPAIAGHGADGCVVWGVNRAYRSQRPAILSPEGGSISASTARTVRMVVYVPRSIPASATMRVAYWLGSPGTAAGTGSVTTPTQLAASRDPLTYTGPVRPLCDQVRLDAPVAPAPGTPMDRQVIVDVPRSAVAPQITTATPRPDRYAVSFVIDGVAGESIPLVTHVASANRPADPTIAVKVGPDALPSLEAVFRAKIGDALASGASDEASFSGLDVRLKLLGTDRAAAVEQFLGVRVGKANEPGRAYLGAELTADEIEVDAGGPLKSFTMEGARIKILLELSEHLGELRAAIPTFTQAEWGADGVDKCGMGHLGIAEGETGYNLKPAVPAAMCTSAERIRLQAGMIEQATRRGFTNTMAERFGSQIGGMFAFLKIGSLVPGLTGPYHAFTGPLVPAAFDASTGPITFRMRAGVRVPSGTDGCTWTVYGFLSCSWTPATQTSPVLFRGSPRLAGSYVRPEFNAPTSGLAVAMRPEAINELLGALTGNGVLDFGSGDLSITQRAAPYIDRPFATNTKGATVSIAVPGLEVRAGSFHALIEVRATAKVTSLLGGQVGLGGVTIVPGSIKVTGLNATSTASSPAVQQALQAVARLLSPVLCEVLTQTASCPLMPKAIPAIPLPLESLLGPDGGGLTIRPSLVRGVNGSLALWADLKVQP